MPIAKITQKILDQSNIPYLRTDRTTADIFLTITEDVSKLTADDTEKISLIQTLAEQRLDFDALDTLFDRERRHVPRGHSSTEAPYKY
jgi:BioD-like phosphotransacetylase family protein